jgi:FAD/FMN-containing dehydrogenase
MLKSTTPVVDELVAAVGTGQVIVDEISDKYLKDWSGAAADGMLAVLRPRTTAELAAMLRICHAHGQTVVPQGGLTGLVGGAVPSRADVAISLERMDRIEAIDLDSGTVTVQAGAILQKVQEACRDAGAFLALDLGSRGSCQIGGNLSTNAGGNRVIRYGMARDLVLGLEVVLADGTVLHMMNQAVKNNAGMDLKHLFIGSEGVLGIITRAVLKLHPLPAGVSTALVATPDYPSALRFLRHAQQRLSGQVSAFEIMWNEYLATIVDTCRLRPPLGLEYPVYVLIDMQGGQPESDADRFQGMLEEAIGAGWILDGAVAQSVSEADAFWALRDGIADVLRDHAPTINFDVSVAVGSIGACAELIREGLRARWPDLRALFFGHVGDGNLHVVVCAVPQQDDLPTRIEETVYAVVRRFSGSISAEHGIGILKKEWLGHSRTAAELEVMRALKQALDPKRILNPGKLIPDRE